jgi:16S rRNA (cytidine1402-2'-O)-methyltransferase
MTPPPGRLLLVPNALDLGGEPADLADVLPHGVLRAAAGLRHWVAENAKTTRAFLKRVDALVPLQQPLQALDSRARPRPPPGRAAAAPQDDDAWRALLAPAVGGEDVGLISEAGLPAVADPGSGLVAAAHALQVPVLPLAGPSSLLLALAASGLNGQCFAFVGYLPQDDAARAARLRELEARSRREAQTQIVIETPYRNEALLRALLEQLAPATRLAIAHGVTMPGGWCRTRCIGDWRRAAPTLDRRLPTVFLFEA